MKKRLGKVELKNGLLIYDGVTKNGRSTPLAICPTCGKERRVNVSNATRIHKAQSSLCIRCALKGKNRITEDEICENGVVIHWSKRKGKRILITLACGHPTLPKTSSNVRAYRTNTGLCCACANALVVSKSGKSHSQWKGGRTVDSDGYVRLHVEILNENDKQLAKPMLTHNNYVLEHRLVMARQLGRPLKSNEIVHHLNGIKDDNRFENLQQIQKPEEHIKANNTLISRLQAEIMRLQFILDTHSVAY